MTTRAQPPRFRLLLVFSGGIALGITGCGGSPGGKKQPSAAQKELALESVLPKEAAVRAHPQDGTIRLDLARAYRDSDDPAGAALALAPLLPSTNVAVAERFATACSALGWLDEAEAALPAVPAAPDVRLDLAKACVQHGDGARAIRLLTPLTEKNPSAETLIGAAGVALQARNYPLAVQWAEASLKLAPENHAGKVMSARCWLAAHQPEGALRLFPEDPAGAPLDEEAAFWRGRAEVRSAAPAVRARGIARLERIAGQPPTPDGRQPISAFEAGRAYLETGKPTEATRLLSQAWSAGYQPDLCLGFLSRAYTAAGHPRDAAWCEGKLRMSRHEWSKATAAFRKCLELDRSKPVTYLDLARALSAEGKLKEALKILDEAERAGPRDLDRSLLKAAVLGRLERVADEQRELTAAAEWAGKRANEPLGNLGKVLYNSQQFDAAIPALERALKVDDGDSFAHLYLGLTYARRPEDRGQAALAVQHLLRAAAIQRDYHYPWVNAGSTLLGMGADSEAAACYRRAIDGDPRWDAPYLALSQIYQRQGLTGERKFILKLYGRVRETDQRRQETETKAKAATATADDHFALGDRSLRDGRPKEALAELLVAVAQRPGWKQAQGRVADACALLDFDAMREEAESAAR